MGSRSGNILGTKLTIERHTGIYRTTHKALAGTMNLSVIIITRNEAHNIAACLASVAFANEWIIVDSGSTDGTVGIAREAGAQVIETPDWPGFGAQKNRALATAKGEWILSLDADERVCVELREEILATMTAPRHDAYEMPRLSSFCGRFVRHGGWYPDHIVRLFKRGIGSFSDNLVHERVIVKGVSGRLRQPLIHYSYRNDDDYLRKLAQYSSLGAKQAFSSGKRAGFCATLLHAVAAFTRCYLIKRGFLDGKVGLMVALCAFETTYHKYFKLMLMTDEEKISRK